MPNTPVRLLKVFLCHASGDKPPVRDLYKRLVAEGVDAWLDQEKLLPGQNWRSEIPKAVREADVVVVCLSKKSITKEGYVQKEIKFALDIAEEKPEDTIFLIPARLEELQPQTEAPAPAPSGNPEAPPPQEEKKKQNSSDGGRGTWLLACQNLKALGERL